MKNLTNIMLWTSSFLFLVFITIGIVSAGENKLNDNISRGTPMMQESSTIPRMTGTNAILLQNNQYQFTITKVKMRKAGKQDSMPQLDIYFELKDRMNPHLLHQVEYTSLTRKGEQGKITLKLTR